MKLTEAVDKINFDIEEGEDEIINRLVEAYNAEPNVVEFVYKNRHYIDKIDEARIGQFIEHIGRSKFFTLKPLHERFMRYQFK